MTEACGTTNCTMMEVGGATNSMMKVCRATKSKNLYFYGNRYETVYLMMRQKLLHRIDGCIWSYQSHDDRGMWWYQLCETEVSGGQGGGGGGFEQTRILLTQQVLFPCTIALFLKELFLRFRVHSADQILATE